MPLRGKNVVVEAAEPTIYGVSRRKFLIGASAAAATPFIGRLAVALLDQGERIDFDALGLRPVSIGYVEGSGTFAGPESLAGARIVPAAAARSGDGSLTGRVVKAMIHGLFPSRAALAPSARTVAVNGLFASRQPDAPYPFFAWTLQAHDVGTMSHRSNFRVGLDRNPRFGLTVETQATDGRAIAATVFGTGTGANMAKLRTGTYLLGVGHNSWDRPRTLPALGDPAWERLASIVLTVDSADD
jgi:hypothetical protein